jgi:biotin carboxyl carrier protein
MAEEIRAPLAGKVIQINVGAGDQVQEDDEVLIMEAMKMETPVYAPASGTVQEVKVKKDDAVEEDDLLVVIE